MRRQATEIYFQLATHLLYTYEFKNPTQRRIWELHCDGLSKREIEGMLYRFKKRYRREQIGNIINHIKRALKTHK